VTPIAILVAIGVILGACAGPILARSRWCQRVPQVAGLAWLGILAGALAAIVGVVVMVSAGQHGLVHHAAEWLGNCWHPHHDGASGPTSYVLNVLLLGGSLTAAVMVVLRYRRTVTQRRRHQEALQFVVRTSSDLDDVCVLDHPVPVVYCVPSRRRPIVVSSGALDRLAGAQLQAVLAHERVHLRHRHHLFLTVVDALAAALFWLPTFREARDSLPLLLEMVADDVAARRWGREAVAMALRKLAISPSPVGGLAAGGSDTSQLERRLNRLETEIVMDETQLQRLTWATATTSIIAPFLISTAWIMATPLIC
jgi:Zn-dependent protease with chaperone function